MYQGGAFPWRGKPRRSKARVGERRVLEEASPFGGRHALVGGAFRRKPSLSREGACWWEARSRESLLHRGKAHAGGRRILEKAFPAYPVEGVGKAGIDTS